MLNKLNKEKDVKKTIVIQYLFYVKILKNSKQILINNNFFNPNW